MLHLTVTARHFKAPEELQETIERELQKLNRFHPGLLRAHVVLEEERGLKHVEVRLNADGREIVVKEKGDSYIAAVNQAVDVLVRQLRKLKTQRQQR
ncbi:MAG: ribosome-associated translation inhibitor RaiA [Candidatus Kapabacteria bacterium]|nr:ribosome-associated translation inhibitor RaiA [Candidatus Kapabacteria bacterium]MDW8225971.1 ribosome-associated translation inhibitor RaiA [Bacteroidota bacterium]